MTLAPTLALRYSRSTAGCENACNARSIRFFPFLFPYQRIPIPYMPSRFSSLASLSQHSLSRPRGGCISFLPFTFQLYGFPDKRVGDFRPNHRGYSNRNIVLVQVFINYTCDQKINLTFSKNYLIFYVSTTPTMHVI